MAGGLILKGENCNDVCFVLDGDLYFNEADIETQINRAITGHGEDIDRMRQSAKASFLCFDLPEGQQPERYLHALICQQPATVNEAHSEIIEAAQDVGVVANDHHYLSDVISRLGLDKRVGLSIIAEIFSQSTDWESFVRPVVNWLEPRIERLREVEVGG